MEDRITSPRPSPQSGEGVAQLEMLEPSPWTGYEAIADAILTPENLFRTAALGGDNCFLTGAGGTGKSTQLRDFIAECPRTVDVTAPTGVAALNVGGMTIHRFTGMMLGPAPGESNEAYYQKLRDDPRPSVRSGFQRVRCCEVLVIDEVSMLCGRHLDFVEFLFRRLRGSEQPFGGCQVIVTGDFLQLPPVRTSEAEPYDWAFQTQAWQAAGFRMFKLEKVRRQDEGAFVKALLDFRVGRVQGATARLLQSRVRAFPPADMPRLFTHNVMVDRWNNFQLGELPGEETAYAAVESGPEHQLEFLKKNLLTPETLRLKRGALVMFTVNLNVKDQREPVFVNGQVGHVEKVEPHLVWVHTKDGDVIAVERFDWKFDARDPQSAIFSQFPLRLAWAMTIHKAQGLSLDSAYLDIRAAREPGQAYVAVSRVRSLAGLQFKDWIKGVHVSPEAIQFYEEAA
jgi:ATP-dependent DNA helicase PIF1